MMVPDIDWVEVPAGKFKYGEECRELFLPAFRVARYPVTNAQFECFIEEGGYETDAWWEGLVDNPEPTRPRWDYPNHPRETVSWYEAVAFSRWLDARLQAEDAPPHGWEVRLPTEQEWEKAARGTDGREYPWGDYADGCANIDETVGGGKYCLGRASAVGIYLNGASPFGVLDMAGNVWEWSLSKRDEPSDLLLVGNSPRVLRGGSHTSSRYYCRCADRNGNTSANRVAHHGAPYYGFRVCCAPRI